MTDDIELPPPNTTTLILHYLAPCYGTFRPDAIFTVRGIRTGAYLRKWLEIILSEHDDCTLDATIELYWHHPNGDLQHSEITHCAHE